MLQNKKTNEEFSVRKKEYDIVEIKRAAKKVENWTCQIHKRMSLKVSVYYLGVDVISSPILFSQFAFSQTNELSFKVYVFCLVNADFVFSPHRTDLYGVNS